MPNFKNLFSVDRRKALRLGLISLASVPLLGSNVFAADPIKVAAVYTTPIEEPYIHVIHSALLKAKEELGIEYVWSESVKLSDYGRVLREFATGGADLIMGESFADERAARRVAREFPEVAFAMGSSTGDVLPNFITFNSELEEPAYLCGMLAGGLTKSNTIGLVVPMAIPPVNRVVQAYAAGAREVNPDVKVKISYIGSFFDPPKAKEATIAQIEAGVDIIYAERLGVIEAARERGIVAFGNMEDQSELAPDTVLTSVVWDMWPATKEFVTMVQKGTFKGRDYRDYSSIAKKGVYLAPYKDLESKIPADLKEMVAERTQELAEGKTTVARIDEELKSD